MKRLLISRPMPESVVAAAQENFAVVVRDKPVPMTPEDCQWALTEFDAVMPTLGDCFGTKAFTTVAVPRCRMLANFGVGYNHIDVVAARAAGVMVSNTPGAVTDATADIGVMLILMAARRASEGEALVRSGQWLGWGPTQLLGQHISCKSIGIIGMGRIGQAIARRCHFGFGMDVRFFNRSVVEGLDFPAEQVANLGELAQKSDVLVVALPGGRETVHMVNAAVFEAMPAHGVLVNIARGEIVDEAALISALQNNQIAGAGLDVYEFEPEIPDELRACQNVTLLPHMGTATLEVRQSMGLMAVANLNAWNVGDTPPNLL